MNACVSDLSQLNYIVLNAQDKYSYIRWFQEKLNGKNMYSMNIPF